LLNDESALLGPGKESVARYLELVGALSRDAERTVAESYSLQLRQINDRLLTESNQAAFRSWIRTTFSPMFAKIGWAPGSGESDDLHLLRSGLIALLGGVGRDEEVVRRSVELARQYVKDSHAMDPSIAGDVLKVAARTNDASLFEGYLTALRDPGSTPEVISNVSTAMAEFTDPQLVSRWLEIASAPETRNQDSPRYFARSLRNADAQKVAWPWIKEHWSQVESKLTMSSGVEIVAAAGDFCTAEMRDDVQKFFSEHRVPSSERTLKQSLERINACVGYRERQQTNLNGWLAQQAATVTSGRR
jgi:aminopeptidase N